jgi:hypothetical protein
MVNCLVNQSVYCAPPFKVQLHEFTPDDPVSTLKKAAAKHLQDWLALPPEERSEERPWIMGFNAGWEAAFELINGEDH